MRDVARDVYRHRSGFVRCPQRGATALVNAVERRRATGCARSIVWCSLRAGEQSCPETCGAPRRR